MQVEIQEIVDMLDRCATYRESQWEDDLAHLRKRIKEHGVKVDVKAT